MTRKFKDEPQDVGGEEVARGNPLVKHLWERDRAYRDGEMKIKLSSRLEEHLGHSGRLISGSKTSYVRAYPDHDVMFNACLFDEYGVEVWFGDIDLTLEADRVQAAADEAGQRLVLTPEWPYRFEGPPDDLTGDDRIRVFDPATDGRGTDASEEPRAMMLAPPTLLRFQGPTGGRCLGPKFSASLSCGCMCLACGEPMAVGDLTTLVALGPGGDPESRRRAAQGRWYNAVAVEIHWACATGQEPSEDDDRDAAATGHPCPGQPAHELADRTAGSVESDNEPDRSSPRTAALASPPPDRGGLRHGPPVRPSWRLAASRHVLKRLLETAARS